VSSSGLTDEDPTPPQGVGRPGPTALVVAPPRTWADAVLQLVQSALTVGGALALVWWGKVSGEAALAAIAAAGGPAIWRAAKRILGDRPPPAPPPRPPPG
jgi:hypothetical protein